MKKTKQKWTVGDVLLIPLKDGVTSVVAQVVGQEQEVLNSVTCAFFDLRVNNDETVSYKRLPVERVFAVLFCTRDLLDLGLWKVVDHVSIDVNEKLYPYEHLRASGWIGAKVRGSGVINRFLNAFYAIESWDDYWKDDPKYFDRFLVSPEKKPSNLLLKVRDIGDR